MATDDAEQRECQTPRLSDIPGSSGNQISHNICLFLERPLCDGLFLNCNLEAKRGRGANLGPVFLAFIICSQKSWNQISLLL